LYKLKLKNGLIILFEKRKGNVVSISANIKQGFASENEKQKGISHFTEHFVFKGTEKRSHKEIVEEVEKKGGILNAFTDEEATSFWCKMPKKYFGSGIEIASDLMLKPKFNAGEFEKEKRVILEEIKMHKDSPPVYALDKIKELLYKKPFGLSGAGTIQSVSNLKREDILKFYSQKYKTNRMFLCVIGNAELEEIKKFGEKFPSWKGNGNKARIEKINKQLSEKRKNLEQAHFVFGFHMPSTKEKGRHASEIIDAILTSGMSSRLFEEIREKRGMAYDIRGFLEQGSNFGYEAIYMGTTKDQVKKCKEIILKEIKNLQNLKIKDLDEIKEKLIGLRQVGSEESVAVMTALISEEARGNAEEFYKYEENVNKIKLEDAKKTAKIKSYSSFALIPEK